MTQVAAATESRLHTRADITAYNRAIGARIKEARTLAGLSQSALARAVGVRSDFMGRAETGIDIEGGVAPWMLHRIAVVCCVKVDFLLGLTEESEPDEPGPTWRELAYISNGSAARDRARYVADLAVRDAHLAEFYALAAEVLDGIQGAQAAMERVIELNPRRWENVRGGVRLADAIEALEESANGLARRSRFYVEREMIAEAPEILLDLEIAAA
ncbi:helix-turn-helix transcriptional regulator [Halomonas sp. 25-S5]|uniref:helix-turn-helix domain-containing protein n=1 Tax=Halomonas sp. 25-S5 TaxID=2994065 RepID=UPI002469264B|nr:helix-turn-helix transcriptional regulator [Halomonas sp. 25-S5]